MNRSQLYSRSRGLLPLFVAAALLALGIGLSVGGSSDSASAQGGKKGGEAVLKATKVPELAKAPEGARLLPVVIPYGTPLFGQSPTVAARELEEAPKEKVWRVHVKVGEAEPDRHPMPTFWNLYLDSSAYSRPWRTLLGGRANSREGKGHETVDLPIPPEGMFDLRLLTWGQSESQLLSIKSNGKPKAFEFGEHAYGTLRILPKNYATIAGAEGDASMHATVSYESLPFEPLERHETDSIRRPAGTISGITDYSWPARAEGDSSRGKTIGREVRSILPGLPFTVDVAMGGALAERIEVPALAAGEVRVVTPTLTPASKVRLRVLIGKLPVVGAKADYVADEARLATFGTPYPEPVQRWEGGYYGENVSDVTGRIELDRLPRSPNFRVRIRFNGLVGGKPVLIDYFHSVSSVKVVKGIVDLGNVDVSSSVAKLVVTDASSVEWGALSRLELASHDARERWRDLEISMHSLAPSDQPEIAKRFELTLYGLGDHALRAWVGRGPRYTGVGVKQPPEQTAEIVRDKTDRKGVRDVEIALRDVHPKEADDAPSVVTFCSTWAPIRGTWTTGGLVADQLRRPAVLYPTLASPLAFSPMDRGGSFSDDPHYRYYGGNGSREFQHDSGLSDATRNVLAGVGKWSFWLSDGESFGERPVEITPGNNFIEVVPTMMTEKCPVLYLTVTAKGKEVPWVWVEWFPTELMAKAVVKDNTRAPGWGITCTGSDGRAEVIGMPPTRPIWIRLTDAKGVASIFKIEGLAGGVAHERTVELP